MADISRIKQLANKRGIKMKYLCEQLDVNPGYFSNVAQGRFQMSPDKVALVAKILGTTVAYLNGQVDDPSFIRSCPGEFSWYRFETLCMEKKVLKSHVEEQLNISPEHMENAKNGLEVLNDAEINSIAAYFETSYAYLTKQTDNPTVGQISRSGKKIAVFGDVAAGIPIDMIDNFDPEDTDSWEEIDWQTAKSGTYFSLRIKGESMEPRICDGDVVIVRYQPTAETGEIAVVAVENEIATCKKILWEENGGLFLLSLNPAFPPQHFTADEVRDKPVTILGKVVELRGKM